MKNEKTRRLAEYSLFMAIIFALGLMPFGGYIPLPWANITILHIPVIVGAALFGVDGGIALGAAFGITSVIRCFTFPDAIASIILGAGSTWKTILFMLLILVLPRVLVGIAGGLIPTLFKSQKPYKYIVSSVVASVTNSVLVLGALAYLAYSQVATVLDVDAALSTVLTALFSLNALNIIFEAIAAAIICPAIIAAINALRNRHPK